MCYHNFPIIMHPLVDLTFNHDATCVVHAQLLVNEQIHAHDPYHRIDIVKLDNKTKG